MIGFEEMYSWVKDLPIIDWHNHLDMQMIAADNPLGSLYEVWVKSDPYKHRTMRICGEPERLITGDADEDEKWAAWVRTLPKLVGNPLFAWAKMEMEWLNSFNTEAQRRRGTEGNCGWLRELENVSLAEWTPSKILKAFNVEYISPCVGAGEMEKLGQLESLEHLDSLENLDYLVVPSLRLNAGDDVSQETLERFHAAGCRVVDVSVDDVGDIPLRSRATIDNRRPISGRQSTCDFGSVAAFAATHDWTMLLHLGALRETSARLRAAAGPAGGFAGMRVPVDPMAVADFLNELESTPNNFSQKNGLRTSDTGLQETSHSGFGSKSEVRSLKSSHTAKEPSGCLPRTILLSLNPEAHAQLAVLAGSFVEDGVPGKVQLGPAWWWCDHEDGIRDVLEKNAAYGVLSTFIGMTTDSRSLLSFVRHDYFRRILCKWVAEKVASGAFPNDEELLRPMLENICYRNARNVFSHKEHKGHKEGLFTNDN